MTTVYLTRHGYVDNPQNVFYGPEFPLSPVGYTQIQQLASDMAAAQVRPELILASPFLRTQQTAHVIASTLQVDDVRTDVRLREWDVGGWYGRPLADFYRATGYDADPPPPILPPGIEPLPVLGERVAFAIADVCRACRGKVGMVVSHREALVAGMLFLQQAGFDGIHHVPLYRGMAWKLVFDDADALQEASVAFDRSIDRW